MNELSEIEIASTDLAERDKLFFSRIYSSGLQKYINRLNAIGFNQPGNYLDAGCGFGQWSLSASLFFGNVTGIDVSKERIEAAKKLAKNYNNVRFLQGTICKLPFDDETFDYVFSYSVIYYTNVDKAIKELVRVLKPGGKIYICSNGVGWYLYNIIKNPNKSSDFNPRLYGLKTLWCSALYYLFQIPPSSGDSVYTSISYINNLLKDQDVSIECAGPEGSINVNKFEAKPENFFPGRFLNLECCSEWVGIKNK
jgi:ubiquinone/menaquinone biosynthesis C-methylase UbiE